MKTVVLGDPPEVLVSLLNERKRLAQDTHDEVWQGNYHMAPAAAFQHGAVGAALLRFLSPAAEAAALTPGLEFNLGEPDDFRVPDLGFHGGAPSGVWIPTAAIVVEVRSPDDESYEKFGFYFDHDVEEILVADLETQRIEWFLRGANAFEPSTTSALLALSTGQVATALGWPNH